MRKIDYIIVHCAATPEGKDFSAKDIDRWHKERGFRKIGYHYVIKLDGTVEKGRDESEVGAHCKGHNSNSIGVCFIGGCDSEMNPKDTRTNSQKSALYTLLSKLKKKYPNAKIYGHNHFDKGKACPSFRAEDEYSDL